MGRFNYGNLNDAELQDQYDFHSGQILKISTGENAKTAGKEHFDSYLDAHTLELSDIQNEIDKRKKVTRIPTPDPFQKYSEGFPKQVNKDISNFISNVAEQQIQVQSRRIDLENNNERFVAGKNDKIEARETARYEYAKQIIESQYKPIYKILDIGCSSGYGSRIITKIGVDTEFREFQSAIVNYTGIDYDQTIIDYAKTEFPEHRFFQFDITTPEFITFLENEKFDTIIAFEVLEHIDNGKELAQILKRHCKTLICSVPYNEPVGFWGEHHKLHGLTEKDFPNFDKDYISFDGEITNAPTDTTFDIKSGGYYSNPKQSAVMLMNWKTPFINGRFNEIKYSIVIPTYNHLQDLLIPCLNSIFSAYQASPEMKVGDIEIIIVANGCTDGTEEYVKSMYFYKDRDYGGTVKLLSFPHPLGYTRAANEGIKASRGEYVVLLNNDVVIHDKDWLEKLSSPLENGARFVQLGDKEIKVLDMTQQRRIELHKQGKYKEVDENGVEKVPKLYGETGAILGQSHVEGLENFIIGFCSMIPRKVLNEVGLMDEQFSPGGMDDADLSIRIQRAGYDILPVKLNLYHPARSSTFHDLDDNKELFGGDWQGIFDENIEKLRKKWLPDGIQSGKPHVLCEITTKNRYFTTLPLALMSVAMQTRTPDVLVVYDDTDESLRQDLRENPTYKYIFSILESKGIVWYWEWTNGQGQVHSHQAAQERAKEFVWRLDDDCVAELEVLEKLLHYINIEHTEALWLDMQKSVKVGAVGTLILTPNMTGGKELASYKIQDIYSSPNWQWFEHEGAYNPFDVEHLHCSFLYRKGIANYDTRLSKVGHREETIFTHEIFRSGYNLAICKDVKTWHLKNPEGGIRSHDNNDLYVQDERIFSQKMVEWGVIPTNKHIIYCNNGKGDHYVLRQALPKIIEKHGVDKLVIVCHEPSIFADFGVRCMSEQEAKAINLVGENQVVDNIYGWCWKVNWKDSLVKAYERQNA